MMFVLYRESDGAAVSVGSVLASPLPAGLKVYEVADVDTEGLRTGRKTWDAATRTVADAPPEQIVKSSDEKLAEAKAVLDQITALPAPVLTADVVDLLDDLRGVL